MQSLDDLPEPAGRQIYDGETFHPVIYTSDQMRAYRAEGVAQERERCAKMCEEMHPEDGPHAYAWAIRAGHTTS
jgi:hypothetical protein